MKKKLLILLGAGSSVDLDLPSVSAINVLMQRWAADWAARHGFPNFFQAIWDAQLAYVSSGPSTIPVDVNFETVLRDMSGLIHWTVPAPFGNSLKQMLPPGASEPVMDFPEFAPHASYGRSVALNTQMTDLLATLAKYMRGKCVQPPPGNFRQYKQLLSTLRERFSLGIYSLAALVRR